MQELYVQYKNKLASEGRLSASRNSANSGKDESSLQNLGKQFSPAMRTEKSSDDQSVRIMRAIFITMGVTALPALLLTWDLLPSIDDFNSIRQVIEGTLKEALTSASSSKILPPQLDSLKLGDFKPTESVEPMKDTTVPSYSPSSTVKTEQKSMATSTTDTIDDKDSQVTTKSRTSNVELQSSEELETNQETDAAKSADDWSTTKDNQGTNADESQSSREMESDLESDRDVYLREKASLESSSPKMVNGAPSGLPSESVQKSDAKQKNEPIAAEEECCKNAARPDESKSEVETALNPLSPTESVPPPLPKSIPEHMALSPVVDNSATVTDATSNSFLARTMASIDGDTTILQASSQSQTESSPQSSWLDAVMEKATHDAD
jgi:hypothetical protein